MKRCIFPLVYLVGMMCYYFSEGKDCPQGLLAVITSAFGAYDKIYDVFEKDVSGCVNYFLFTDSLPPDLQNVTVLGEPYHILDDEVQEKGAKNSYEGIRLRFKKRANARLSVMHSKYYKALAWRLPSLHNYRYILHHDANILIGNKNLYRTLMSELKNYSFVNFAHPRRWGGIQWEAVEATYQLRYRIDGVKNQTKHYLSLGYPDIPKALLLGGVFMYDARDVKMQSVLTAWYKEIQIWSIECQISFPYVFWKLGLEDYRIQLDPKKLCNYMYPNAPKIEIGKFNPFGYCYVDHIVSKKEYGSN
jgi:hypothetical protein